ncbi:hypothetical protein SAMN06265365_104257 [Tistlia consotensis]|uniref:DUF2239 domain-containing protein n=1 Tax=Tistlia consotensis USBA 355 TaxID=560819 RepID=A0A1Y6BNK3_9PROT|nr:DUF2239 family protein [Tistlia consotensis]SMF20694.1 hypothetical protein SAMN05428998_10737 [Tistlia consotensis USBA 355]SNR47656.1 hypothetical protein SAMN06265365_104257 [Tistlia consotensis]
MTDPLARPCTAFEGQRLLRAGSLVEVALAVRDATARAPDAPLLVFDDATGRVVDLDLRGSEAELIERLSQPAALAGRASRPPARQDAASAEPRGRGRPKLGVVAREVTLLPRHWEWLAAQPGGASAALRRLVEEARRSDGPHQRRRAAQEAAYRFLSALAGDLPGYEEACRALFADDRPGFERQIAGWPADLRAYAVRLAFAGGARHDPAGAPVEQA